MTTEEHLRRALALVYAGDRDAISRLLEREPALVTARVQSAEPPYNGYFWQATLLHHVAGNPYIAPLPANVVDVARVLLEHGAETDALTRAGPDQPRDIGWTTLGLAATSAAAREAGVQRALIDLLLERGADPDRPNGGALMGALFYGEVDAAAYLVERGATVDLIAAAGLGRVDLMSSWIGDDGRLAPRAHSLVHYSRVPLPEVETDADVLNLAMIYACMGGHVVAAERLRGIGASLGSAAPFYARATPLHWAAYRGHAPMVDWLLAHGADRETRDAEFAGAPRDWAAHAGHETLARVLR